mmetsp:Transcript_44133/g.108749  ORF Transcript_44133/g.108749 Transcript_44133/m.108749 type:complete len:285 (-) Transcript_44133:160-1014(-)
MCLTAENREHCGSGAAPAAHRGLVLPEWATRARLASEDLGWGDGLQITMHRLLRCFLVGHFFLHLLLGALLRSQVSRLGPKARHLIALHVKDRNLDVGLGPVGYPVSVSLDQRHRQHDLVASRDPHGEHTAGLRRIGNRDLKTLLDRSAVGSGLHIGIRISHWHHIVRHRLSLHLQGAQGNIHRVGDPAFLDVRDVRHGPQGRGDQPLHLLVVLRLLPLPQILDQLRAIPPRLLLEGTQHQLELLHRGVLRLFPDLLGQRHNHGLTIRHHLEIRGERAHRQLHR